LLAGTIPQFEDGIAGQLRPRAYVAGRRLEVAMTRRNILLVAVTLSALGLGAFGACAVAIYEPGGAGTELMEDGTSPPLGIECGGTYCGLGEDCCLATMQCFEVSCTQCCPGNPVPPRPVMGGAEPGMVPAPDVPLLPEPDLQGPTVPLACGAETCDRGELCCRATGRCYAGNCPDCCPTDGRVPEVPVTPGRADAGIGPYLPR
jgi:hypothetical protein